jgi:multiple sugar transport system ATP-binding protein
MGDSMHSIKFSKYCSYYKVKKEYILALSDINLTVDVGQFLVVIGESGSGKSTFIKACLGMNDYFEGDLLIDGVPVEKIDMKTGKYACVRQEISLYPNLTIYENIAFPLRIMSTPQEEVDKRVKQIAEMLDISLMLTRKPRHLSGGQQQRVAIGRAFIKNPAFLYFDEPFSSIDSQTRIGLRNLVQKIHKQLGVTIVFVTHNLDEAFALADRIVVLDQGKIIEDGTPAQLKKDYKSDLLKAYFDVDFTFSTNNKGDEQI